MSYHRILDEPAKTGRGKCKICDKTIDQSTLRVRVVDARAFNEALRIIGHGHQGASRGYVETQHGVISVDKYFAHLDCYQPIKPHPYTKDYFDIKALSRPHHKAAFETWLSKKADNPFAAVIAPSSKTKKSIKITNIQNDEGNDEDYGSKRKVSRKKKIAKKTMK